MRALLILALFAWTAPHRVTIMDIQGRGHTSPLDGDTVTTTGVVTVVTRDGYYLQDPLGDNDPETSDGLFVYTGAVTPFSAGDRVRATGAVHEYRPGNHPHNLTVTELSKPSATVLSTGDPLPAPVRLGNGGRVPPAETIDGDSLTRYEPDRDGIDFYESLEGMRVLIPDATAVSTTGRFGELWVVGDGGRYATGVNARGGLTVSEFDFNPERIQLDDTLMPRSFPDAGVGDRLGDVTGVVSYRYGNFEVLPGTVPSIVPAARARDVTALRGLPMALTVATFNAENLHHGDTGRIAAVADIIVTNLGAPDVVALQEVQDDSGASSDGTVEAGATWLALVSAVRAAGGPLYDTRDIAPENGRDGGAPGANIRVGILFRPDRVGFVERGTPSATEGADVIDTGAGPALTRSPGRVEPADPAWENSRKPLAAEMTFAGERFFVVVCHFSSRSGSSPLFGALQPPVEERAEKRFAQAGTVRRFVERILAVDAGARVIVMGDFNDFSFSATLRALTGPLVGLVDTLPEAQRYTYNYEGNSQALDHILVSRALARRARLDIVHTCSDFSDGVSDHDPAVARLPFDSPVAPVAGAITAAPNPFDIETRLRCTVPGGADVACEIFDVSGRRVRRLMLVPDAGGAQSQTWDGRNDRGRPVPCGVYLIRAVTPRGWAASKVVRVQ